MKVNKTELLKALSIVKPGLSNNEVIEQATSFAFIENRVITFNNEISISHPVKGLELEGAIQADEFYKLLNKVKKEEIELVKEENQIIIQSGKMKAGILLQQNITLPLDEISNPRRWKDLPEDFVHFLKKSSAICSKSDNQPILTCVHVNKSGNIESSDNYKVMRCELGQEMPVDTFLIPAASVNEVVRITPVKITSSSGWVHFKSIEETIISCRIFADSYPDIEQFLDVEGIEVNFPRSIIDILERAEIFYSKDTKDKTVDITLSKNRIKIESKSEYGWFEEEANIHYNDTRILFSITPYALKDILTEVTTCILNENRMKFEGAGWVCITVLRQTIEG